jgi:hypothetical protein
MARIEPYENKSIESLFSLIFKKKSQVDIFGISSWAPIDMDFITI